MTIAAFALFAHWLEVVEKETTLALVGRKQSHSQIFLGEGLPYF